MSLADVSSANIVGYSTLKVSKSYSILAINFENVSGGELAIQDAFPVVTGMTAGNTQTAADQIQVMKDDGNYDTYYLSNGYNGKSQTPATENKWVKTTAKTVPTEETIKSGKAFWYVSKAFLNDPAVAPYDIQVAGQVMSASADTREIAQSYMLVGNPYPAGVPFNDGVKVTTGATYGNTQTAADQIQVMTVDGNYDTYYLSNGYNGKSQTPATENKWVKTTAKTVPTEDYFPAGRGAWFVSKSGSATIEFTSPIAK